MKICTVEGCNQKHYCRGFCGKHYQRVRHHGNTTAKKERTLEERFWQYAKRGKPDECWLWTGDGQRYGLFAQTANGETYREGAHRVAHRLFVGPVPDGMVVMHTCDVPKCVNPAHLRVGTYKENMADMRAKGRNRTGSMPRGEAHSRTKLTEADVRMIRASSLTPTELGRKLGVDPNTVRAVLTGKSWRHLA